MKLPIITTVGVSLVAVGLLTASEPHAAAPRPLAEPKVAEGNTISVTAQGDAFVQASHMLMKAKVVATAEVGEEAVTNFVQARARADGALRDLEIEGLVIEAGGVEFDFLPEPGNNMNNQVFFAGSGMEEPVYGVTCREEIAVRFPSLDDAEALRFQVATAIDTAIDLGLKLKTKSTANPYVYVQGGAQQNQEATVRGELSDQARVTAERQAQEQALQNARATAASLAELSGRNLGRVNSIAVKGTEVQWQGIGVGMKVGVTLEVVFDLQ